MKCYKCGYVLADSSVRIDIVDIEGSLEIDYLCPKCAWCSKDGEFVDHDCKLSPNKGCYVCDVQFELKERKNAEQ